MAGVKQAPVIGTDYNEKPGMDRKQRHQDSQHWEVPPEMMFKGVFQNLTDIPYGPQVGSPYDVDPLGENREMITHHHAEKLHPVSVHRLNKSPK